MKHFADHAFVRRWIGSILFLIFSLFSMAQDIAIGTWRTHFSYLDARIVEVTPDKIFCATQNGLFSREIATGEIRRLSKIDGLSDVGISAMKYDEVNNVLVIGYRSGFVDFIYEDQILSISDIANTNLDKDKTINDIAFSSNQTFLATDLGVIVASTATATIDENFVQIGAGGSSVDVFQIIEDNNALTVRTEEGIQSGSLSENLLDFNSWNRYPSTSAFTNLTQVEGEKYALSSDNLMQLIDGSWQDTGIDLPTGTENLFGIDTELFTVGDGVVYRLTLDDFFEFAQVDLQSINDLVFIGPNLVLADSDLGLIGEDGDRLSPTGPLSDDFSNFRVIGDEIYGFHAPSASLYNGSEKQPSFSVFSKGEWEIRSIEEFINVSDVASFNGNLYYSSIGKGMYDEFNNQIIMPGTSADLDTVIVSLAAGELLWASSFDNNSPIHVLDTDDAWRSLTSSQLFGSQFLTIDLSETGVAWLGSASGSITVFDLEENSVELINTSDGLPSSFTDVEITVEDNAWVATSRGPALFPSASFISSDQEAILPTFENRVLFEDERINAVVTDGGNRVWFGTENGVWIYDENTSEQVAIFNEENSPLPSNHVLQMRYNEGNGEVFILTDKGMVSYRSASSFGRRTHRNVNVFPNPVRPDYQGLVGLTGLARNVNVKITDLNGNLVKEINANGGSAAWDLRDIRGGSVNTGIYLFFSSSADGEETYVGKIAVIR